MGPGHILRCSALWALVAGCAPVDPPPKVDEDGEPIPVPGAYDDYLTLEAIETSASSGNINARPLIRLRFSDYLDDDSFVSYGIVTMRSGGVASGGSFVYSMTYKTIVWQPYTDLVDGFDYTLSLHLTGLSTVTQAPFSPPQDLPTWRIDASLPPDAHPIVQDRVTWSEVDALFERRCRSCHGDTQTWPKLNPLTPESLVGVRSTQLPRYLVRALDPTDSYIMHKLLPDYADRRNGAHPPEWGEDPTPLRREELWMIERWIAQGAVP